MFKTINRLTRLHTIKSSAVTITSTFTSAALGALYYLILARILGSSGYGVFSVGASLALSLSTVADLGTSTALVKFVASHANSKSYYPFASIILRIKVISSIIFSAGLAIFSIPIANLIFKKPELAGVIALSGLVLTGMILFNFTSSIFQGEQKFFLWGGVSIVGNILRLVVMGLIAFTYGLNPQLALAILALPFIAIFIFSWRWIDIKIISTPSDISHLKTFWKYNFWIAGFTMLSSLVVRLDTIIASAFLPIALVGVYALSTIMVSFIAQLSSALGVVYSAKFSSFSHIKEVRAYLPKAIMLNSAVGIGVCLLMIPAGYIVTRISGKDYSSAFLPFLILLIGNSVYVATNPLRDCILYYFQKSKYLFWLIVGQGIIAVATNLLLIKSLGIFAPAISVCINLLFLSLGSYLIVRKLYAKQS